MKNLELQQMKTDLRQKEKMGNHFGKVFLYRQWLNIRYKDRTILGYH